jgi:DNA-binding transcriptional LysR family regulator
LGQRRFFFPSPSIPQIRGKGRYAFSRLSWFRAPFREIVGTTIVTISKRAKPRIPDDLARHSCVQYRRGVDGVVFEWPFERNGKSQKTSVGGRVMVNNPDLALRAAVDGLGIAYMIEASAEPFLRSGQLVRVLEDWSPTIEGLFLYYPGRRQVPAALRALIDMIRTSSSRPAKSSLQNPFAEH